MLPPLSLIIRGLHGYPRDTDSRVKKKKRNWRKREKTAPRTCPLSDPAFHDRLMWDRVAIEHGEEVTAFFYCARDGSLIWDLQHVAREGGGRIKRSLSESSFDAHDS